MDARTWRWWSFLRGVSLLNLGLLGVTAATQVWSLQLACAGIYVGVCAFRSFWPRIDLERTVLVDHPLSAILLGRTAATIAEMAFTVQLALFLTDAGAGEWLWSIVPLIAVAQGTCWMGVLTGNHLWHAAEETLWALMLVGVCSAVFVAELPGELEVLGVLGCLAGAFVMLGIDVPMYRRRYLAETKAGTAFRSVREGWSDAWSRREQTGSWEVWKHEVTWMTPYFSACVWLSIGFAWL